MRYAADYDDVLPYVQSAPSPMKAVDPYVKNLQLWESKNPKGGKPLFNMALAGFSMADIPEVANTPMLYDAVPWPDGMFLVAYADGHVKFESEIGWTAAKRNLSLKLKRHGKPIKPM